MSAAATLDFSQSVPVPSTPPQPDYGGVKPVVPGNIQWYDRPQVKTDSIQPGTHGTVYSESREENGLEVLYPRIYDGALHSSDEAWQHYKATGQHMGKFKTAADADAFGQKYHEDAQAGKYDHPAQLDFSKAVPLENDPDPGYAINDVGNKVIVPKEGEQFQDTINRAVTHWKSLSSEDQQKQMNAEIATMPEKVPEALTGAAIAGIAGPAALAAPGEIAGGVRAAVSAPLGGTAPIVRALPHIARLANVLYKLGITTAAAKMLLDEFMPDEHKK